MRAPRRRLLSPGLVWLIALIALIAAAALAACTIDRRSDAYVCNTTPDCSGGRICVDQLCVVPPDGGPGGDSGLPATCPAACTRCDQGTCFVDCVTKDCDNFTCPAGWKCNIACGQRRCNDLDCGNSECDITCIGSNACEDVRCGPKRCNIVCDDRNSCENVDCSTSCACQLTCNSVFGCLGSDLSCPAGCAVGTEAGCDGTTATCNRCM